MLDTAQEAWYFHWRARLRAGEALPTDLSYVFLHVYEVLHGIGFDTPEAAFAHLQRLWRSYRTQHPKLDRYLVDWLTDFTHYYDLTDEAARAWRNEAGEYAFGDQRVLHWLKHGERADIPDEVFRSLITYRPEQNKFYRDATDRAALDAAFRRAIALTDAHYLETRGRSVYDELRPPRAHRVIRVAFNGAVFEGPALTYTAGYVLPYGEDGRLSALLNQAVRYAENLARARAGSKNLLRGVRLEASLAAHLDVHLFPTTPSRRVTVDLVRVAALQRESAAIRERLAEEASAMLEATDAPVLFPSSSPATTPTTSDRVAAEASRRVTVDFARVVALQAESAAIRERLSDEAGAKVESSDTPTFLESPTPTSTIPLAVMTESNRWSSPSSALTQGDTGDLTAVLHTLSAGARELLHQLHRYAWEAPEAALSMPHGTFVTTLVDEVNEATQLELGDLLLTSEGAHLVVMEDYRETLASLLGKGPMVEERETGVVALEAPWQALADVLSTAQLGLLEQLLRSPLTPSELDAFAGSRGALGSALLEELNERALEAIGDVLIDPYNEPLALEDTTRLHVQRVLHARGIKNQDVTA